jgi:hypothetical protein
MTTTELKNDIQLLSECELIRYELKGDVLSLLVVADCEEHEHHHCEEDEEPTLLPDEEIQKHGDVDECCDGLNGNLFRYTFQGVKDFKVEGEECDNYKTRLVSFKDNHLHVEFEGINMIEANNDVIIDFSFESYDVVDEGEIVGAGV